MEKSSRVSIKYPSEYRLHPNDSTYVNKPENDSRSRMQANLINALRSQNGIIKLNPIKLPKYISISNRILDQKQPGLLMIFNLI